MVFPEGQARKTLRARCRPAEGNGADPLRAFFWRLEGGCKFLEGTFFKMPQKREKVLVFPLD